MVHVYSKEILGKNLFAKCVSEEMLQKDTAFNLHLTNFYFSFCMVYLLDGDAVKTSM